MSSDAIFTTVSSSAPDNNSNYFNSSIMLFYMPGCAATPYHFVIQMEEEENR